MIFGSSISHYRFCMSYKHTESLLHKHTSFRLVEVTESYPLNISEASLGPRVYSEYITVSCSRLPSVSQPWINILTKF